MKDVTLTFTAGPLRGESSVIEVGHVVIGRQPGQGGVELKGAETSISRAHAELVEVDGKVVLRNLSPNGTTVNGKLILDEAELETGAILRIGSQFELRLEWWSAAAETIVKQSSKKDKSKEKSGPLASPIVRALLVVYLGGIAAVGIWFGVFAGDEGVADDWPGLVAAYRDYQTDEFAADEWERREREGQILVRELKALRTRGMTGNIEVICRELMNIDGDTDSPLYRYGMQCLTSR